MDGRCSCLESDSPDYLVRHTGVVTGKLLELCTEHCMTPSLSKNKTEILFSFKGESLIDTRRDFMVLELQV